MNIRAVLAACALSVLPVTVAQAAPTPDPALQQSVSASEVLAQGQTEISKGHVDLGPLLADGNFAMSLRDDTVKPAVWRRLDDVVLRVTDAALLEIPADEKYAFLGLPSGSKVHVVPQTQAPEVVWVGWNTQHPSIASLLKRGVTLRYQKVEGPGALHVFLQNGFDPPQPLWSSSKSGDQDIWVDLNTHTHANWVFSQPGNYQVKFQVRAEGIDGQSRQAEATVKFAVGSQASAAELFAAKPLSGAAASTSATPAPVIPAGQPTSGGAPIIWIVTGAAGLGVLGLIWWFVRRQRRAEAQRRAAFEEASGE